MYPDLSLSDLPQDYVQKEQNPDDGGSNPYCPKGYRTPNQREMAIMANTTRCVKDVRVD